MKNGILLGLFMLSSIIANSQKVLEGTIVDSISGSLIPYAEVSVGIENLFKFVRLDAVWRVTHRNKVGLADIPAPNFGIRAMFATAL